MRFQNRQFQNRLDQQRKYTRGKKTFPQTDWEIFLSKIGLASKKAKITVALILAFLVYIVYIPNFLYIKTVQINGITPPKRGEIQKVAESYLNKKLPLPQKNLGLLSTEKLKNYLLKNNQSILKIEKITKVFPNNLIINITPRQDSFIIESKNGYFAISNDGLISKTLSGELTATSTLPNELILIKLAGDETLFVGQQAFAPDSANSLKTFYSQAQESIKSTVDYFEMSSLEESDIVARSNGKFNVLFNLKIDSEELGQRLKLLFSQFTDQELYNLEYVDVRFEDRGYVCHKYQPCVKDIQLLNNEATGTPENLQENLNN